MTSNRFKIALRMILLTVFPAAFWYGYYHVIEGLRGTPLTIWHTSPNNIIYLGIGLIALVFSIWMPIKIAWHTNVPIFLKLLIIVWALTVIIITLCGGYLVVVWMIGCYGWGTGCI